MLFNKTKRMQKELEEKQKQIDVLVKILEEEMQSKKEFNNQIHLELCKLDYEKGFEMFEKAMNDKTVKFVLD